MNALATGPISKVAVVIDTAASESRPQTARSQRIGRTPQTVTPFPSLYQINTRVSLTALSRQLERRAKLDDIPDSRITESGFDYEIHDADQDRTAGYHQTKAQIYVFSI
jgi:hypothetical protein